MKEEFVRELLKRGHLISPNALKKTNTKNIEELTQQKTIVLLEKQPETQPTLTIEKYEEKKDLTTKDFLEYYTKKYEAIREVLLRKTDSISVNKAAKSQYPVTTTGMVRELLPTGFVFDDPTGEITVVSKNHNLCTGDVAAVSGTAREGKLFADQIILPDIPLTNTINRIENTNLFLSYSQKGLPSLKPHDILVTNPPTKHKMSASGIPNPAWITISGPGRVTLLTYKPESEAGKEEALQFLRKRYITPNKPVITKGRDPFLLVPPPDIFWIVSGRNWSQSYKGITVVSCRDSTARVNLNTREVDFL
jgi:hypothetical protein